MKTAGVAIDTWKLEVFKRRLDAAGFKHSVQLGVTEDTLMLHVEYGWVEDLIPIIEAANAECAKTGGDRYEIPSFLRRRT